MASPGHFVFGRRRILRALAPVDGVLGTPPVLCPPIIAPDFDSKFIVVNLAKSLDLLDDITTSITGVAALADSYLSDINIAFSTVLT